MASPSVPVIWKQMVSKCCETRRYFLEIELIHRHLTCPRSSKLTIVLYDFCSSRTFGGGRQFFRQPNIHSIQEGSSSVSFFCFARSFCCRSGIRPLWSQHLEQRNLSAIILLRRKVETSGLRRFDSVCSSFSLLTRVCNFTLIIWHRFERLTIWDTTRGAHCFRNFAPRVWFLHCTFSAAR